LGWIGRGSCPLGEKKLSAQQPLDHRYRVPRESSLARAPPMISIMALIGVLILILIITAIVQANLLPVRRPSARPRLLFPAS
jgi:hypothetical protein